MTMEFEKSKLIELKEKFDSIINTEEKDNNANFEY